MKTISIFTGAGGLDLGLEVAGFTPACCVEINNQARATLQLNRPEWNLLDERDIFSNRPEEILACSQLAIGVAALLVGGPPCQPFSKAGFWHSGRTRRLGDPRADPLQAFLKVAAVALPEVVLLENVDGLMRRTSNDVIELIEEKFKEINRGSRTRYRFQVLRINAADYGVPQVRRRIFMIAHRQGLQLTIPRRTHGSYP